MMNGEEVLKRIKKNCRDGCECPAALMVFFREVFSLSHKLNSCTNRRHWRVFPHCISKFQHKTTVWNRNRSGVVGGFLFGESWMPML